MQGHFTVEFSARAEQDLLAIFRYYNDLNVTLPKRFMEELDWLIERIQSHPYSFQRVREESDIRRAVMHLFPHIIAYDVWQQRIVILRVRSSRQDPAGLP